MKLSNEQFTEAAFIFEKANGNFHSDYETRIIANSDLTKYSPAELEQIIVNGLNTDIYS